MPIEKLLSMQQQSQENTVLAQHILSTVGHGENLTPRERTALEEMPDLFRIIKGKKPSELNLRALRELEKLARDDSGMIGNVSRNLLTLHGYHFTPVFNLPVTEEEIAKKRSFNPQDSNEYKGQLFPNPAKEHVTIQFPQSIGKEAGFTCNFFSTSGVLVKTLNGLSGESKFCDLKSLTSGLYYYHFSGTDGTIQSGKLIIQ